MLVFACTCTSSCVNTLSRLQTKYEKDKTEQLDFLKTKYANQAVLLLWFVIIPIIKRFTIS